MAISLLRVNSPNVRYVEWPVNDELQTANSCSLQLVATRVATRILGQRVITHRYEGSGVASGFGHQSRLGAQGRMIKSRCHPNGQGGSGQTLKFGRDDSMSFTIKINK